MITRYELIELLKVLNFYFMGGLAMGISVAPIVVNTGIVLVRNDYGLPFSPRVIGVLLVIFIGVLTGLLAYLVLLPAELKVVRRKLKPILLAKRLSRKK